jgi:hypothetical protein
MKKKVFLLIAVITFGFTACENNTGKGIKIASFKVSECKNDATAEITARAENDFSPAITAKTTGNNLQINVIDIVFNCCPEEIVKTINVSNNVISIDLSEKSALCRCTCNYDVEMLIEGLVLGTTYTINITQESEEYYSFVLDFESDTDLIFNI